MLVLLCSDKKNLLNREKYNILTTNLNMIYCSVTQILSKNKNLYLHNI